LGNWLTGNELVEDHFPSSFLKMFSKLTEGICPIFVSFIQMFAFAVPFKNV